MNTVSNRYENIDAVRGLAALFVVWMHVSEVFRSVLPPGNPGGWMYAVADTFDFGRIGVVAFFAVSGFVIPASFNYQGWFGLKIFWVRRFFRLYPAFWLSIPFAIWSTWTIWDKTVTTRQVLANLTIAPGLFNELPLEGLYWTLQIELYFYVCCSILFLLGFFRKSSSIAFVTSLFFIIYLLSLAQNYINIPIKFSEDWKTVSLFLSIMFWGALFRLWFDKKIGCLRYFFILWGIPLTLIVLMLVAVAYKFTHDNGVGNMFLIKSTSGNALGLVLFLSLALWRHLSSRPLLVLGEISYALYLFHPVVFFPVHWWAGKTQMAWVRTFSLEFWVLAMMVASVLVAYVVHRWVELPAIKRGKEITSQMVAAAH